MNRRWLQLNLVQEFLPQPGALEKVAPVCANEIINRPDGASVLLVSPDVGFWKTVVVLDMILMKMGIDQQVHSQLPEQLQVLIPAAAIEKRPGIIGNIQAITIRKPAFAGRVYQKYIRSNLLQHFLYRPP